MPAHGEDRPDTADRVSPKPGGSDGVREQDRGQGLAPADASRRGSRPAVPRDEGRAGRAHCGRVLGPLDGVAGQQAQTQDDQRVRANAQAVPPACVRRHPDRPADHEADRAAVPPAVCRRLQPGYGPSRPHGAASAHQVCPPQQLPAEERAGPAELRRPETTTRPAKGTRRGCEETRP